MKLFHVACATLVFSSLAAQAEKSTVYRSPTGNISCITFEDDVKPNSVTCEVFGSAKSSCKGPEFRAQYTIQDGGKTRVDCMNISEGEGLEGVKGQTLAYDDAIDLGIIRCGMSEKGIFCKNGDGHGFELSRAKQRLF